MKPHSAVDTIIKRIDGCVMERICRAAICYVIVADWFESRKDIPTPSEQIDTFNLIEQELREVLHPVLNPRFQEAQQQRANVVKECIQRAAEAERCRA